MYVDNASQHILLRKVIKKYMYIYIYMYIFLGDMCASDNTYFFYLMHITYWISIDSEWSTLYVYINVQFWKNNYYNVSENIMYVVMFCLVDRFVRFVYTWGRVCWSRPWRPCWSSCSPWYVPPHRTSTAYPPKMNRQVQKNQKNT